MSDTPRTPQLTETCIAPPGNLCTETGCWDADRCVVRAASTVHTDDGLRARIEALVAPWTCENYVGMTCRDDPRRRSDAIYAAELSCWPCRLRDALDASPTPTDNRDAYGVELDRRMEAEQRLTSALDVVEQYESCGPKRQCTRDVLAAVRAVLSPNAPEGDDRG